MLHTHTHTHFSVYYVSPVKTSLWLKTNSRGFSTVVQDVCGLQLIHPSIKSSTLNTTVITTALQPFASLSSQTTPPEFWEHNRNSGNTTGSGVGKSDNAALPVSFIVSFIMGTVEPPFYFNVNIVVPSLSRDKNNSGSCRQ